MQKKPPLPQPRVRTHLSAILRPDSRMSAARIFSLPSARAIEEVLLLAECSMAGEWEGQVRFLPRNGGNAIGTKLTTVSVRLDTQARVHVDKAAQVLHQSGAFLAQAGEEAAERILLQWAVAQYTAGAASLSQLAAETQLPLERIAQYVTEDQVGSATDMYLTSCQQLSRTLRMPKFYLMAKRARHQVRQEPAQASARQQER